MCACVCALPYWLVGGYLNQARAKGEALSARTKTLNERLMSLFCSVGPSAQSLTFCGFWKPPSLPNKLKSKDPTPVKMC